MQSNKKSLLSNNFMMFTSLVSIGSQLDGKSCIDSL